MQRLFPADPLLKYFVEAYDMLLNLARGKLSAERLQLPEVNRTIINDVRPPGRVCTLGGGVASPNRVVVPCKLVCAELAFVCLSCLPGRGAGVGAVCF
jgi:hypothetical protein